MKLYGKELKTFYHLSCTCDQMHHLKILFFLPQTLGNKFLCDNYNWSIDIGQISHTDTDIHQLWQYRSYFLHHNFEEETLGNWSFQFFYCLKHYWNHWYVTASNRTHLILTFTWVGCFQLIHRRIVNRYITVVVSSTRAFIRYII